MKKYIYLSLCSLALILTSCDINSVDEIDMVTEGTVFFTSTSTSVALEEGVSKEITVGITKISANDTFVAINVLGTSSASHSEFTFNGNIIIPAGASSASSSISFDYDMIPLNTVRTIVIALADNTSDTITISYEKSCVNTNDVELSIIFDNWPTETSWEITDSTSMVVESGGAYGGFTSLSEVYTLASGDYTFTIFDAYGDGICCTYGNGSYSLFGLPCADVLVSGGSFGNSESTMFTVP